MHRHRRNPDGDGDSELVIKGPTQEVVLEGILCVMLMSGS